MLTRVIFLIWIGCLSAAALSQPQELEPYDAVRIQCPAYPSLESDIILDGLGVAALPASSRLVLAGLTVSQAEEKLRKFYETKLGVPLGAFRLKQIANANAPIRIFGAVKHSGLRKPTKGLLLSELLEISEPTDIADLSQVEIRTFKGIIHAKVGSIDDKSSWDLELRGGDKVFVPNLKAGAQVYVLGHVVRPGSVPFVRSMTVRNAIDQAGGFLAGADKNIVMIDRDGRPAGIVDLSKGNPVLEPGDSVRVSQMAQIRHVVVTGGAVKPGILTYFDGMTLLRAIETAGGIDSRVTRGRIKLVRRLQGRTTSQFFEIAAFRSGQLADILLMPDDRIEIPEIPR